jgi:hypothetical protein
MTVGANSVVYMLEMRRQLEGKEMTDVEVVCEDGTLTCHAVMLAAASRWWTQVRYLVDRDTTGGGHSYGSWWTRVQQLEESLSLSICDRSPRDVQEAMETGKAGTVQ